MSTPFLGEIRVVSYNFAMKGWALCNGQLMAINQNQALFSLLGTMYGGDGITTFALPNLQGRAPVAVGSSFVQGQQGGSASATLNNSDMPIHSHTVEASTATALSDVPSGEALASAAAYAPVAPNTTLNPAAVSTTGGASPIPTMPPYLGLNYVIALQGIFPSRS